MYALVGVVPVGPATTAVRRYRVADAERAQLERLLAMHWRVLHVAELVTDEPPMIFRSIADDIVEFIEVFSWRTADAPARAAGTPAVVQVWRQLQACCTTVDAQVFEPLLWPLPLAAEAPKTHP